MDNLNNQKTMNADSVFGRRFLNSKSLYLYCFNTLPSIHFVGDINGEKAYKAFKEKFEALIQSEHSFQTNKTFLSSLKLFSNSRRLRKVLSLL